MAQRKKSVQTGGHRHHGAAAGLSGPAVTHAQSRVLHSVDTHPPSTNEGSIWGRRRVLLLNSTYEPLTALPMRRAVIMLMCGKATVVHDDPNGPGDPLRDPVDRGAVGDPAAFLRPGAVPGAHPDDARGADAPRPVSLRLLRRQGRHRRPRGAAQPRWRPLLGELRGGVLDLQSPQGRPVARRTGLDAALGASAAEGTALAVAVVGQGTRPGVGAISG